MTERDGWNWVYANRPPPQKKLPEVCFTGFKEEEKTALQLRANSTGWLQSVKTVTLGLEFLCCGPNAGPAKMQKAKKQDVYILSLEQFEHLLATGEIL